ncbi:putative trans-sialidase, Group II [Trypanosoma cruzi]|uniref:Trans-sialidase, putative n=2 Tax=Trypanosoma cruzi TaxID=5693 RepID=Q4CPW8_TRYCC|nr:trans-sialidase, putative [Trypanosoma cruzi]EAN82320.1 trans-sialidase, putative [Trypanosoma cruzi]PWU84074.1 putative trans-sialidase, Group II [Trypanosoma cruzi]|eukprot:XP_804171.1 trans-sialidase [Trypanosoma cruzi strain CL Brener]
MLSRVAAVKAPRTHNRRRMTGSSGRRREGRECEPQRPNMSRHVFTSAVLLFLVVMMCCSGGASNAVKSNSGNAQLPHTVDLFVPQTTQVLPNKGTNSVTTRDSFNSPSIVSAGGVIVALAEGQVYTVNAGNQREKTSSDVVAEYIDASWDWSTLVGKVSESKWKANTVICTTDGTDNRVGVFYHPTTTTNGNKVFLLAGSLYEYKQTDGNRTYSGFKLRLELVLGDVREPTSSEPTERIKWGEIRSLLNESTIAAHEGKWTGFLAAGGSGVLMEDGTLVFPLMAKSGNGEFYSMIIYSTDNGSTWALSTGVSPAKCLSPRITEWDGSLLMIVNCKSGQRVYESRDMGKTWTGAAGTLPGVWANPGLFFWDLSLRVEALITATIDGRKVMLYTQRGDSSGEKRERALYLWVTDNNRSFYFGPIGIDSAVGEEFASTLMYSDGNLHLLQQRGDYESTFMSLSRLTEELSTINSVLKNWAQKDAFFSKLSIPTAGLVAVLSDTASNGTWIDEYLCLNATVRNATKVKDGFQFTGHSSRVSWYVNTRINNVRHISLSHNFTLVASLIIEEAPSNNTPLLTATLANNNSNHTMGVSYSHNKLGIMFEDNTKTQSSTWEPKKEHQVALMLQGNKISVHIDGESLGEEETPLTGERQLELAGFCFGACGMQNSPVTVKNVFLYNRPLNSTEMRAIKDRIPVSTRAPEPQVKIAPKPAAPAVPGPREVPAAPGRTTVGRTANTQHAPAERLTSAGNEGTAREKGDGGANGDDGSAYGRGLLPLLLLLWMWGFAAA